MQKLLSTETFEEPAFADGGMLINEVGRMTSDIDLRNVFLMQNRKVTDVTAAYQQKTAERFLQLKQGKVDAFR